MAELSFFAPMKAIPGSTKQEHGANHKTGKYYSHAGWREAEEKIRAALLPFRPAGLLTGPLSLKVVWSYPAGKSHRTGDPKVSRPDLDNLQKGLQDIMQSLGFFANDGAIVHLDAAKAYGEHAGIYIRITELEKEKEKKK